MNAFNLSPRSLRAISLTCGCPCRNAILDRRSPAPFTFSRAQDRGRRAVRCTPLAATQKVAQTRRRTQKKADKQEKEAAGSSKEASIAGTEEDAQAGADRTRALEDELYKLVAEHGHEAVTDAVMENLPEFYTEDFPVMSGDAAGYTPFEYIQFTKKQIDHDITMQVNAPLGKVYRIWANRMNYNEWFDLIGQVVLHTEDPEFASYFFFYRWGRLPTLELYATLQRTVKENEYVLEEAVDGMDLAAGAYFSEKDGGTEVRLRVSYLLPEPLQQFVGPVGVWGDVNDILTENLEAMKLFVENVDEKVLDEARAQDQEMMIDGLRQSNEVLDELKKQLDEEDVFPGEGSPQARAGMIEILREAGYPDEDILESRQPEEERQDNADDISSNENDVSSAGFSGDVSACVSGDVSAGAANDGDSQVRRRGQPLSRLQDDDQGAGSADMEPMAGPSGEFVPSEDGRAAGWGRRSGPGWNKGSTKAPLLTKEYLLANLDKTQTEIAKILGVSPSTVSKMSLKNGIEWPRNSPKSNRRKVYSKEK